jgi:hypothetical protein
MTTLATAIAAASAGIFQSVLIIVVSAMGRCTVGRSLRDVLDQGETTIGRKPTEGQAAVMDMGYASA